MSKSVTAWAPTHATLYFAVPDNSRAEDRLHMGSLGGGLNFEEGVTTLVTTHTEDMVHYNGERIDGKISLTVLELFRKKTGVDETVEIFHESKILTGCGLSTSGAGSIGLSIALNHLFETGMSHIECLQIAHEAEIICKTGLGSVMGQSVEGIEIRRIIGAPGVGRVVSIPCKSDIFLIILGPLSTSQVLSSKEKMEIVTKAGVNIHETIGEKTSLEEIMDLGFKFAKECGLMTNRVRELIEDLHRMGETRSTMAMIGETLVVVPYNKDKLRKYCRSEELYFVETRISSETPHVLS